MREDSLRFVLVHALLLGIVAQFVSQDFEHLLLLILGVEVCKRSTLLCSHSLPHCSASRFSSYLLFGLERLGWVLVVVEQTGEVGLVVVEEEVVVAAHLSV